jgi:5-formyltetrahydrofolate cyclo-ligase
MSVDDDRTAEQREAHAEDRAAAKRTLRRELRARLQALPRAAFVDAGAAVAHHLAPRLPPRGIVASFAGRDDEIATAPLHALARARGLAVALPRMDGDALAFVVVDDEGALPRDRFGIAAPPAEGEVVPLSACGLVVVPGLAFDERGGRLGHGRGFYDRALAGAAVVDRSVVDRAVGVFLDEQCVARVPVDAHDVRLRCVCTPTRGLVVVDE